MDIGLIDVDSHNFPNLCLMKLAAYHKAQGDRVEWYNHDRHYDIVYQSKVFDDTYSKDIDFVPNATQVIKGGTGYGLENRLPDAVEHITPDYSLYGIKDTAYGFLTRGCPRHCAFCIVGDKEGLRSHKVADLSEFWSGQPNIELLDPNLLACKDRMELLDQLIDSRAVVNINQGFDIRLTNEEIADKLGRIDGTKGCAIVEGSEPYEVEFEYKGGEISQLICSCFCSYNCKHEFAAMMQLKETLEMIEKYYAAQYNEAGYFAAVNKGTLFAFAIDGKEAGSFTL